MKQQQQQQQQKQQQKQQQQLQQKEIGDVGYCLSRVVYILTLTADISKREGISRYFLRNSCSNFNGNLAIVILL